MEAQALHSGSSAGAKPEEIQIRIEDLSFYYSGKAALKAINMAIYGRQVTAFIGPSGCGKSTLLRCLNRMNELIEGTRVEGRIFLKDTEIYAPAVDVNDLRQRVGMVFQKSNPFPKSIFENVAFGLRIHGTHRRSELADRVEQSLKAVALWEEVADRLHSNALMLSGGQQQRLCIARAIATQPEVLLMDEPCSALDPIATGKIEELIHALKQDYTIVIVTHNMQQAARVSDYTGFTLHGELIEYDATEVIFQRPSDQRTEDYITGKFG